MFFELKIFFNAISNYKLWTEMANSKMRARFNRTVLGPLWEILGSLILLLLLAYLWSRLWGKEFIDFFTYILVGYTLWRTILSSVTDANSLFAQTYLGVLKNVKINFFVLAAASSYKNLVTLLLNLPLIIFVLYLNDQIYLSSVLFLISFLILFFLSSTCATFLLAVTCLKYRDLEHSIGVVLGMLFFFTPIIWSLEQLGERAIFVKPNLLYHYLHFFRSGLQNGSVNFESIIVVVLCTIFLVLMSCYVHMKVKSKLAYWLD